HYGLDTAGLQHRVECVSEFTIAVMDEIAFAQKKAIEVIGELPGALLQEGGIGMWGDPGNLHSSRAQLHHHQDIVRHEPMPGGNLDGKKVSGSKDFPVKCEKLRPAHAALTPLRSRTDMMTA